MRLHLLSDLHLEWGNFEPPEVDADMLVLAGDIGVGVQGIEAAKRWAPRYRFGALFVAGNHDYYRQRWPSHIYTMQKAAGIHKAGGSPLVVLENEAFFCQGVRFFGATLWTDFALYGRGVEPHSRIVAKRNVHDYDSIRRDDDYWLTPLDTQSAHQNTVSALKGMLTEPHGGPTVVVTHHAPSEQSLNPRYRQDPLNPAYASNLEHLLGPQIDAWAHGHTHYNVDYTLNGTRVVANCHGYRRDLADDDPAEAEYEARQRRRFPDWRPFDPGLVVEV